ncbi:FUSC family protein [Vibrio aestuarianus]|uniref:FUSC family protein n=1 Tax=Vibrio aestuarianus TaxID=28171 RepID=UPI00237CD700|nr:FUSC family protein [Vibrio aestuarianus]MDE1211887.1 FUSC family protein [Vibrio aestuarianus]MDE1255010.1 FUSC family protein [Vibrio aestuarianus]
MLSSSTKEAIKVALSMVLAIGLAIWFQWEKPYWAALAVFSMAMTESFSHSVLKGHNRILGTVIGIGYALFLVMLFSQDRFLFLFFYGLFMTLCLFMATDSRRGYIFTMAFSVCSIIAWTGGFDSQNTVNTALLRIQETVLGVVTFIVVFRLLWPVSSEQTFSELFGRMHQRMINDTKSLINAAEHNSNTEEIDLRQLIASLNNFLSIRTKSSNNLTFHKTLWQKRLLDFAIIHHYLRQVQLDSEKEIDTELLNKILTALEEFNPQTPEYFALPDFLQAYHGEVTLPTIKTRSFSQHWQEDKRKIAHGVSMYIVGIFMWIYMSIPGSVMFPLMLGIFSSLLPTMPTILIKDMFLSIVGFGIAYSFQYITIMPMMTELWQLIAFYFINILVVWKVFSTPKLMIYRIIGGNLLLIMTMGALHLTPQYDITMTIDMLTIVVLVLVMGRFFGDLFKKQF